MEDLIIVRRSELTSIIEGSLKKVLESTNQLKAPKVNQKLSIDEVVTMTGYKKNTIYSLVHDKKIPFHKPTHGGRKLIFIESEIEDWLKGSKQETYEEYSNNKENEILKSRR